MGRAKPKTGLFSNSTYDILKWVAQIGLPALGTLYFALAALWGLPGADQVVGTIVALDAFLGVILGISSKQYSDSDAKYDGQMNVIEREDGVKVFELEVGSDVGNLDQKKDVTFKVNKPLP